ncbi:hypothetical protein D6829_02615 [Candidatus Pacearchaeota archaeon]|nr:MAG: hypothetical protein D6829_02615 [Candidatus Pacearchaeota archaeon]
MGFLKRVKVPDELPDLAIEDGSVVPEKPKEESKEHEKKTEEPDKIRGENYLEVSLKDAEKEALKEIEEIDKESLGKDSFFNKILEDLNTEIEDLGKLEDWYRTRLASKDVVSDMKYYWEENKAGLLIKSFGSEYKKKITEKIEKLQKLEEEWRAIYFRLIRKEEEMKKEEKELKEILSEFVELCKRRKLIDNEKKETENKAEGN